MTGNHRTGQGVPVVTGPSMVPSRRPAGQRGVGDATGDHDVGTTRQRLDDPPAAEVGIGGHEAAGVAELDGDPERTQCGLGGQL